MKILQISFSNINNLKGGPHVISFNDTPLDTAGIFAIIGPTGSGKSTILDVITLALFNRIPRFKKAITKGEMNAHGSVMTHFTSTANASIIYEIDGNRYTSTWNIAKARTGKLKEYEMTLAKNDAYLDIKRSEVPGRNAEIIGLNYDQFVKSILLSQGQFSKFLKANKNERGQLLEDITGTGIYRKIGQKVYAKFKSVKETVATKKELLGDIQVLTQEERDEIKLEIKKAETEKEEIVKAIKQLIAIRQIKQEAASLEKKIEAKLQEEKLLTQKIQQFQHNLSKLEQHEKVSPFKGDISLYEDAEKNSKLTADNLTKYKNDLHKAKAGLKQTLQKMTDLTQQEVDTTNFLQVMSTFEKAVNKMDADLKNIKEKGQDIRKRINTKIESIGLNLGGKVKPDAAIAKLENHRAALLSHLALARLNEKSNIADQKKLLTTDRQKLETLKSYFDITTQITGLFEKQKNESAQLAAYEKIITEKEPLREQCNNTIQALTENEKNLLKRKEDALKIAKLEDLRATLEKGSPCPLCGSEEHPYSAHQPEDNRSLIDKEIQENKRKLENERNKFHTITDEITKTKTSQQHTNKAIEEIKLQTADFQQKANEIKSGLNGHASLPANELSEAISSLTQIIEHKEKGIEALTMIKLNNELTEEFIQLKKVSTDYQLLHAQRKKKFEGKDPSAECNKLQNDFSAFNTSITENTKAIEIESKDLERAKGILEKTAEKLKPKLSFFNLTKIEELRNLFLPEAKYQNIKAENEKLNTQKTALKTEINTLKKEQENNTKKDEQPQILFQDIEAQLQEKEASRDLLSKGIGEKSSNIKHDDDLRKKRASKEKEIKQLNTALEKWSLLNNMIGDATGNKFANFAQGLTLQNLLVYANKRLSKLSDRYLLDKPKDDGVLQVVDLYQGNSTRAVSTLSGGETFLISLALALSLSDMASRNVALDSLFIDEGFGTLDQETLEIALDTLEKLQTESQKTVGVISHVEALKERINVQIKLEKDAQGYSRIKVEG